MTKRRAALLIVVVTLATYANALGNGFAGDDVQIIETNPVVTTPEWGRVLLGPYWPVAREGAGLYRPALTTSFALEWQAFDGAPVGFHLVSVLSHAAVSLLVLALLGRLVPPVAAFAGALLFAVHPVHVEAVANVVGRAELYAAAALLSACLIFLRGASWDGKGHPGRLAGICMLYLLALAAKESAVVLPGLLVLLELVRSSSVDVRERLKRQLPLQLSLAVVLGAYLVLRTAVLGTVTGEVAAPWLRGLSGIERMRAALVVWPEYLRLLLFPVDLASDYAPDVVRIPQGLNPDVLTGAAVLVGLLLLAWAARDRARLVAIGIAWFCVAVLPVSNLVIPAGLIMAERTLYLPSVGLSIAASAMVAPVHARAGRLARTVALSVALGATVLLVVRSVLRNPTWFDSYTVVSTLATQHPESYVSWRSRASGLARVGDVQGAAAAYDAAVGLAPMLYGLRVEVGAFHGSRADYGRATEHLVEAVRLRPEQAEAYMLLSEYEIRQGRGRNGHRIAVAGLARAGPRRELFALLSESYIAGGNLEAAVRARLAAVGQVPGSAPDWRRLAELYERLGRQDDARMARARAADAPVPGDR